MCSNKITQLFIIHSNPGGGKWRHSALVVSKKHQTMLLLLAGIKLKQKVSKIDSVPEQVNVTIV